jgi:hypothetical protein
MTALTRASTAIVNGKRGCYTRTMTARVQLRKRKIDGRESQGARHQDELIGGKLLVVK